MMEKLINSTILNIPELQQRKVACTKRDGWVEDWKVLDRQNQFILLGLSYSYSKSPDSNPSSCIAVISSTSTGYHIEYIEEFDYATYIGFLNSQTSHAILIRYREYDDTVEYRYGDDHICVIDYRTGHKNLLAPYNFDIGSYNPGNSINFAINSKRNWIAFVRHEISGWRTTERSNERIVAYVYDLADSEFIASSCLSDIESVNSIELPGTGQYLLVTDGSRKDHIFSINSMKLHRIDPTPKRMGWQVAISFSGKDRQIAERFAIGLKKKGVSVFYDEFEKVDLLGKDLYQYFGDVYSRQSEYCLVLISANYAENKWTRHELKAIQSKALELSDEFILPVRLDDTQLPGLLPQIGYLDFRQESIESIVEIISQKVKKGRD